MSSFILLNMILVLLIFSLILIVLNEYKLLVLIPPCWVNLVWTLLGVSEIDFGLAHCHENASTSSRRVTGI